MTLIRRVERLDFNCECGKRADFKVTVPNELGERYGTVATNYCSEHLPDEDKATWRTEENVDGLADVGFVKRHKGLNDDQ